MTLAWLDLLETTSIPWSDEIILFTFIIYDYIPVIFIN